jgi:hypothetical protein
MKWWVSDMARFIDAEPIVKNLKSKITNPQTSFINTVLIGLLDKAPTADVVPVVRCKDCKHYEIHKPSVTLNCERGGRIVPMMPDDYCSYGERKITNE